MIIFSWCEYPFYNVKRENDKYTLLRCYTIWTTRCGFVNVVFGFAARKASRHQLHKHVNTHVYLGVWRITLNSVQAVVGVHMLMSINRFAWHTFVFPDLGSPNWSLRIADIIFRLWKHIFTFTLISCTVKVAFWMVVATASVAWFDMRMHVFAVNRLWFVFPVYENNFMTTTCWCVLRAHGRVPGVTLLYTCIRVTRVRTRYAISWLHVMITSS